MKKVLIFLLTGFMSCHDEGSMAGFPSCKEDFFYYTGDSTTYQLRPSFSEILVEFKEGEVSRDVALDVLSKYDFLALNATAPNGNYHQISVKFTTECNCQEFKEYLMNVNEDPDIFSATPVFFPENDSGNDFFLILLSEVLSSPKEGVAHDEFVDLAEGLGLELVDHSFNYHFRVKDVVSGFESLTAANRLFESGKVQYSQPNFVVPIDLYPTKKGDFGTGILNFPIQ